jgi:AcrR family transcriptional regulator
VQRRSRARVAQILTAAAELLDAGGVDALTTRSLAEHSGIPVATIYRYFENRDAILAAYLDHMLEQIEESITSALMELDRVTFRSAIEASTLAHMRHHRAHPEGIPVWFGGRLNATVVDKVRDLDARLAASLRKAMKTSGILEETPDFNAELLVRLFDRMFEFVFLAERSEREQERIVMRFIDMVATDMERHATPAGLKTGVPAETFVRALRDGLAPAGRRPAAQSASARQRR